MAVKRNSRARVPIQVNIAHACISYKAPCFIFLLSTTYRHSHTLHSLSISTYHLSPLSQNRHLPKLINMAPKAGGSQWDHKSDKDLLLSIIDNGALKGIDWKSIAEKMVAKGYTFSHEACRYVNHLGLFISISCIILSSTPLVSF